LVFFHGQLGGDQLLLDLRVGMDSVRISALRGVRRSVGIGGAGVVKEGENGEDYQAVDTEKSRANGCLSCHGATVKRNGENAKLKPEKLGKNLNFRRVGYF
jgi:hypothetical protein